MAEILTELQSLKQATQEQSAITQAMTEVVEGQVGEIEKKLFEVDGAIKGALSNFGFQAQNYNGDFNNTYELSENAKGFKNTYPIGFGISKGRNDCVKVEIIPVTSGATPSSRAPEAMELLDYMGIGKNAKHFSGSFNILKITVLDDSFVELPHYDFHMPHQHVKLSPSASFMAYTKIIGSANVSNLGEDTKGQWKQVIKYYHSSNPGAYTHIDFNFYKAKVGDEIYIALPTICTGHFPREMKHGALYSPKTELIRKIDTLLGE